MHETQQSSVILGATHKATDCQWSEDDHGNWDTDCDEQFFFETGGPIENRARWCLYCGRRIEPVNFKETD